LNRFPHANQTITRNYRWRLEAFSS
jgi:hypothetical protein